MANYTTKCDRSALAEQIRPLAGKYTTKQISVMLNTNPRYITHVAELYEISLKLHSEVTPEDRYLMAALLKEGLSKKTICEKFEICLVTLNKHLKYYEQIELH